MGDLKTTSFTHTIAGVSSVGASEHSILRELACESNKLIACFLAAYQLTFHANDWYCLLISQTGNYTPRGQWECYFQPIGACGWDNAKVSGLYVLPRVRESVRVCCNRPRAALV